MYWALITAVVVPFRTLYQGVLPHARALLTRIGPEGDVDDTCQLLNQMAMFLRDQGDLTSAAGYFERAAASSRRLFGESSETTLATWSNLAGTYSFLGDLSRASELYSTTLADCELSG
jgi:hypothetical protein